MQEQHRASGRTLAALTMGKIRDGRLPRRRGWSIVVLLLALVAGVGLLLRPATPAYGAPLAPDFTLPLASGGHGTLSLRALRGHPVLLNFFNSSCTDCLIEAPLLRQAARTYKAQGVVVVGVATDYDTAATARAFARKFHLSYPIVVDEHQTATWHYLVGGYPASFFLDAHGRVQGQYFGPLDTRAVRDGLAQAGALACNSCQTLQRPSFASANGAPSGPPPGPDGVYSRQPYPAPRFALRDQNGRLITPASLRGKVVALTFISALCTQQCPLVGQTLSHARRLLGRDGRRLSIVAISVNPEVDMPAYTYAFALRSGWQSLDWHYLTAPRPVLQPIWKAYGVYVPTPAPGSSEQDVVHAAGLYLIDPRGNLRAYYDVPFLAQSVAATVRTLLSSS